MSANNFEIVDLIRELEKVNLEPLAMPALKIIDPIALAIPKGAVKNFLDQQKPSEGQFDFLGTVAPYLPGAISTLGKVAEIKPLMVVWGLLAEALAFVFRVTMPVVKVVAPIIGGVFKTVKKALA